MFGKLHEVAAIALIREGRISDVTYHWRTKNSRAVLVNIASAIIDVPERMNELIKAALEEVVYGYHAGRGYGRTVEQVQGVLGMVDISEAMAAEAEKVAA